MSDYSGVTVTDRINTFNRLRAALLARPENWSRSGISLAPYFGSGEVRYVRPDGTSTGAGGGLADTTAGAWNLAEFVANQGAIPAYARVVFTGTFTSAAAAVTADNLLLDCRLATMVGGAVRATWATAANDEYKISGTNIGPQPFVCISEDTIRMEGLSVTSAGTGVGRLTLSAVDTDDDRVTLATGYTLVNGDKITLTTGTLAGITIGTLYYVVDAQAFSAGSQAVGLSLTEGGAKVDLTAAGSGTRYFFSDFSGRHGVPVAGALLPGQFAHVPWEDALYIKPSTGTPANHTYYLLQQASDLPIIALSGDGTFVLGGLLHTHSRTVAKVGGGAVRSGFLGTTVLSGADGLAFDDCDQPVAMLCEVAYVANHGLGSINPAAAETNQRCEWNYVHDCSTQAQDWGDWQGLVTNPASNGVRWLWNIVSRIGRPVLLADVPVTGGATVNTGALVIDSSSGATIAYNYTHACYGEQVEFGPNDVQVCENNRIFGNIFDLRDLEFNEAAPPCVVRCFVSGPFGMDDSNEVYNNLILLGPTFGQVGAGNLDSGVFTARVTTGAGPDRQLSVYNNVIVGAPGGQVPALYMLRRTNGSYDHFEFVSDANYYEPGTLNVGAVMNATGTGYTWADPSNVVTYDLAGWRTYSSHDATSDELPDDALSANGRPLPGSPLLDEGTDLGPLRDIRGYQGRKFIGAYGPARLFAER